MHAKARATLSAHFEIALTTREVKNLVSNCKVRLVRLGVGLGVRNVVVQELQFVGRGGHRTTIDVPTLVSLGIAISSYTELRSTPISLSLNCML
jgi:hypothetical protein